MNNTFFYKSSITIGSPIGSLTIFTDGYHITELKIQDFIPADYEKKTHKSLLYNAAQQIDLYFNGELQEFNLPIKLNDTLFRKKVWDRLLKIPFGSQSTYKEIAYALKTAPRPIGNACGANPIPLIVPCHRVIGKDGKIGGFSAGSGSDTKRWLLNHEAAVMNKQP
mgnify:CR=1 FL=1|tara:strand:+ start:96552 stop:97049 length:498 start_codon:yes stop_codon:yes gene_type:complete